MFGFIKKIYQEKIAFSLGLQASELFFPVPESKLRAFHLLGTLSTLYPQSRKNRILCKKNRKLLRKTIGKKLSEGKESLVMEYKRVGN